MLIQTITIILGAFLLVMLALIQFRKLLVMREYRKQVSNTRTDPKEEWLIGKVGIVKNRISPASPGRIHVQGAYWDAISDSDTFEADEKVSVVGFRKKMLVVSSATDESDDVQQ